MNSLTRTLHRFSFAFSSCLVASPAFAEVCDKERANWSGEKIGMFGEFANFYLSYLGVFVILTFAVALFFQRTWLFAMVAILNLGLASVLIAEWWVPFEVRTAAITEGCVGSPVLIIFTSLLIGLTHWGLAIRSRKSTGQH